MTQRYLTLDDLAPAFNCTKQTITRWANNPENDFPNAFYIGHRPMWDADDIQAYVLKLREAGDNKAA